jgi:iron complex transport system substrate-binding protein
MAGWRRARPSRWGCRTVSRRLLAAALLALVAPLDAARIVSTSPSITETLFALGVGADVVGVSTYCRYPPQVARLPKVGTYSRPDPEKIALLRPTLAIIHKAPGDLPSRLRSLGIPYIEVDQGSLATVYTSVREIGRAVGRGREAEDLVRRIQARTAPAGRAAQGKRPSALLIVGRDRDRLSGLVAAGPRAYLGELLEAAGARNVLAGVQAQAYPRISLETVIRLDPDVIIDSAGMGDEPADFPERREQVRRLWRERRELRAVRNGRVAAILSEALVVPGPRVIEALDLIAKSLMAGSER